MNDGCMPGPTIAAAPNGSLFESLSMSGQAMCEPIERWTQRYPLSASLAWMGFLFAIVLSVYTPAYETNDDVSMSMIASGTGIGVQPDEHLVFTHVAIGLLLKYLYIQMPSIPWYGSYLLGIHFLSQVAVLYAMLKWRYSRAAAFCYLVLFAIAGVQLITRLQFTSTAIWCVECGLFLAWNGLALRRDAHGRGGWGMLVSGMTLMTLGSLVRFDSYLAAMAISAIPLSALVWELDRSTAPASRVWRTALATIVCTQIAAFGLQAAHQNYYSRDPAWREYLTFNRYRTRFNDHCWTRYTEETKPVFNKVQWSENDHEMIRSWFFDDPQVFGRKNLQAIVEGYPWVRESVSLGKMGRWWNGILKNDRLWILWSLIPLQFWLARDHRFAIRHFLLLTLSLDAVLCGVMFLKDPPSRVYYPLIAVQGLYMLSLMRLGDSSTASSRASRWVIRLSVKPYYESSMTVPARPIVPPDGQISEWRGVMLCRTLPPRFANAAFIAVAILGLCFGQFNAFVDSRKAVSANLKLHADLAQIGPLESELYVSWGCAFPFESILPLESTEVLRKLNLLALGWPQQSPVNDAMKQQFGIRDLTNSWFDNPHVSLVATNHDLNFYRTYLREHYQLEVDFDHFFQGGTLNLYQPRVPLAVALDRQSLRVTGTLPP